MDWYLWRNFDCQVKKLDSFSINPFAKYLLLSLKKEMDQLIIFFVALVGETGFFKEAPSFGGAYTWADLIWRKRNTRWCKKDLNKSVRSKEVSDKVY